MSTELNDKEIMARLLPFVKAVGNMRHFQRLYLNGRTKLQTDLKNSKKWEEEVDSRLRKLIDEGVIERKASKPKAPQQTGLEL